MQINGEDRDLPANTVFTLQAGERITMSRGIKHRFWASSEYAILGEVSTANDDVNDNHFEDERVGRFSEIEEDEAAVVALVSDS
ncbi:MAG: D-lyxose/D-mannose family sugar isomerase [Planctomycetes bacterium]|nr:D-lyxose/D-mannose family sugar isomerase [Planctomycetota bacterium]